MIVGVNGVAYSGKDSIGRFCIDLWGCKRIAFADRMKEFALAVNPIIGYKRTSLSRNEWGPIRLRTLVKDVGWDNAKKHPEVRDLLIRIGTEGGRQILGEDIWINQAMGGGRLRKDRHYVVTDVRFLNEAEAVRKRGGVVVRVERPGYGPVRDHDSENHDEALWDLVIVNDGTLDELRIKVHHALSELF